MGQSIVIKLSEWYHSRSLGRRLAAALGKLAIEGTFWALVAGSLVALAILSPIPIFEGTSLFSTVFYGYASGFATLMFGTSWCFTTLPAGEL